MSALAISREEKSFRLLDQIGNTPLIEIPLAEYPGVRVFGKAEYFNPGGSVKDRPALNMILEGERTGGSCREKFCWIRRAATPASRTP